MKNPIRGWLCLLAVLPLAVFAQSGPTGRWKTIDDETGRAKSIVEIRQLDDGSLSGTVVEILQSDRGPNPTCDRCTGANKDKPIRGMTILWGLRADGSNAWAGGTILDPAKGKTYRSKAQLIDNNRLGVSGCVAFICREQVWQRE
ncbi:DUF2147 domain-containing protein [Luteimonas yindakuii]|uniref:DUF2147 domain-containing protein n=1 Tax=Luteimonas yindakuii TaxID=2565782 RepID=A0A4Z1R3N9_9GAMM|nr:DUF2147 domain-containing protein [Luteimonas yindakuii]QCU72630.1 DUF2147 domain-containing protein [Luteimonas yindakuii]TKS54274.1 DUF2147 domain-containing protein [Luteimonas yindakuii]